MSFKKLLDKAKAGVEEIGHKVDARAAQAHAPASAPAAPPLPTSQPPSAQFIMQHRFQRGVNLGSLFALEKWLTPSLFQGCERSGSELDLVECLGKQEAKARLERHWAGFIDDGDFRWMASQHINTVRLPIGYYHYLCGSSDPSTRDLMKDTEYEKHVDVYAGAWHHVLRIIDKAAQHDIGVLVDLHAAPGAQNKDDHSGLSNGKAGLWEGRRAKANQRKTVQILVALAKEVASMPNVAGLELLNEPQNSPALAPFYEEAIGAIRGAGVASLPLYLGDAWDTEFYSTWVSQRRHLGFLSLDHHLYRCFTAEDHRQSADDHAAKLHPSGGPTARWMSEQSRTVGRSIVVGEWSAALNPASLPKDGGAHEAQRRFATAQLACYEAHAAGHYFWTLKKEGPSDLGWCLYSAIESGVLPSRLGAPTGGPKLDAVRARRDEACRAALDGHSAYWAQNSGGAKMEHWRYEAGFRQGWDDALAFASSARGHRIGFKSQWVDARARAHAQEKGGGDNLWEFEHGLTAALEQFDREAW